MRRSREKVFRSELVAAGVVLVALVVPFMCQLLLFKKRVPECPDLGAKSFLLSVYDTLDGTELFGTYAVSDGVRELADELREYPGPASIASAYQLLAFDGMRHDTNDAILVLVPEQSGGCVYVVDGNRIVTGVPFEEWEDGYAFDGTRFLDVSWVMAE